MPLTIVEKLLCSLIAEMRKAKQLIPTSGFLGPSKGLQTWEHIETTGATPVLIARKNPSRINLIIATGSTAVNVGLSSADLVVGLPTFATGIALTTSNSILDLSVDKHGVLVGQEWYAYSPAAGRVTVIEVY